MATTGASGSTTLLFCVCIYGKWMGTSGNLDKTYTTPSHLARRERKYNTILLMYDVSHFTHIRVYFSQSIFLLDAFTYM